MTDIRGLKKAEADSILPFFFFNKKNNSLTDYAINNRLTPFISMQNHYNLIYREEEREMVPTLKVGDHPTIWQPTAPSAQPLLNPYLFFPALWRRLYSVVSTRTRRLDTPPGRAQHPCR